MEYRNKLQCYLSSLMGKGKGEWGKTVSVVEGSCQRIGGRCLNAECREKCLCPCVLL